MFESKAKVNMWVECGDDYYFGRDGEKVDFEMAAIFYHKAMKKKHPRATYMLGLCHELGRGVDTDMEYAEILYEQAAQYGDMDAKKRLASGVLTEPSEADAPQAASDALALARKCYEQGDFVRARELCEGQASELPYAQFMLGIMYRDGEGVPADAKAAFRCFEMAAEQGLADAQYNLGILYYNGYGTRQDREKTLYWYEKAAAQGDSLAQHDAAVMYYNGIGTPVDFRRAFALFEKSAVQGETAAQFSLAKLYENGEGTERNDRQAIKWMTMAAEQGYTDAQLSLGHYYMPGGIAGEDYDHALFWMDKAAMSGSADAEEVIGDYRITYNNGSRLQSTLRRITDVERITPEILKEKIKERRGERPFDVLALSFLLIRLDRETDCLYDGNIVRAYLSDLLPRNQDFQNLAALLYDTGAIAHLKNEFPDISVIIKKLTDAGAGVYEAETLVRCFTDTLAWDGARMVRQELEG